MVSGGAKRKWGGACERAFGAAVRVARVGGETHGAPELAATALDQNAIAAPLRRDLRHPQTRGRPLICSKSLVAFNFF
jgi:hypothetical protein